MNRWITPVLLSLVLSVPALAVTLEEVGIEETSLVEWGFTSILSGAPVYAAPTTLKDLPLESRRAVMDLMAAALKRWVASADFRDRWNQHRDEQKPVQPEGSLSNDELKARMKKDIETALAEAEQNIKDLPQEYRAQAQAPLEEMRKQLAALDDPANPLFSKESEAARRAAAGEEVKQYREALAQWERDFPADPLPLLAGRLRAFLQETADVDHRASVTDGPDGFKLFSDPANEGRSPAWKLGYRIGKETLDAARAIATTWLQELQPVAPPSPSPGN